MSMDRSCAVVPVQLIIMLLKYDGKSKKKKKSTTWCIQNAGITPSLSKEKWKKTSQGSGMCQIYKRGQIIFKKLL